MGHVVPQASFPSQIVLIPRQSIWASPPQYVVERGSRAPHAANNLCTRREGGGGFRSHAVESSVVYDEMNGMTRVGSMSRYPLRGEEGRRRPGIPNSNKCTICCNYIFIFRTRCLVVYERNLFSYSRSKMFWITRIENNFTLRITINRLFSIWIVQNDWVL